MKIRHLGMLDISLIQACLTQSISSSLFLLNNLERGGIEDHGERFQGLWYGAFDHDDVVVGIAAHFWNHNVLVQCPDPSTLRPLLDALLTASSRTLKGLIGPWTQLQTASDHLNIKLDTCSYARREPLFELALDALCDPFSHNDATCVRLATLDDLDELTDWMMDYNRELTTHPDPVLIRQGTRLGIEARDTWVLYDSTSGELLSTTSNNARINDIFQVGGVWTPVAQRGRGLARRVVAGQIKAMQQRGFTRVMLFTGDDNIPAQRAYTSLGFVHTQDYGLILGIPGVEP